MSNPTIEKARKFLKKTRGKDSCKVLADDFADSIEWLYNAHSIGWKYFNENFTTTEIPIKSHEGQKMLWDICLNPDAKGGWKSRAEFLDSAIIYWTAKHLKAEHANHLRSVTNKSHAEGKK